MATEFSRETSVRKVCPDPSDNATHVKLKVLDKISFIDAKAQHQEYQLSFNNTPSADRVTHSEKAGDELDVERIDKFSVIDAKDYFQESLFSFLRYQEGVHLKTHKRKIYALKEDGSKDESVWIEVERVDRINFVDPRSQYQEFIYELKWPDLADPEWDYRDLNPVVTDYDKTSINPPWRLDPFQNIVDASFSNFVGYVSVVNVNSAMDDIFNLMVNGQFVMTLDFSPDGEQTGFIVKIGDIDKYKSPVQTSIVRGLKTYDSFAKSPFKLGSNSIEMQNIGQNGNANYLEIEVAFLAKPDKILYENTFAEGGGDGASFMEQFNLQRTTGP